MLHILDQLYLMLSFIVSMSSLWYFVSSSFACMFLSIVRYTDANATVVTTGVTVLICKQFELVINYSVNNHKTAMHTIVN